MHIFLTYLRNGTGLFNVYKIQRDRLQILLKLSIGLIFHFNKVLYKKSDNLIAFMSYAYQISTNKYR